MLLSLELKRRQHPHPDAFGHRLVHGGPHRAAPERVTDALFNAYSGVEAEEISPPVFSIFSWAL